MDTITKKNRRALELKFNRFISYIIISLLILGFPLTAALSTALGIDTRMASIGFRLAVDLISILSVAYVIAVSGRIRINGAILIFLVIYFIRLVFDQICNNEFASTAMVYFLAFVAIPTVSVMATVSNEFHEDELARILFWPSIMFIVIYYYLLQSGLIFLKIDTRASLESLNPISLGHAAATVAIIGFYNASSSSKLSTRIYSLCMIAAAIPIMASSGSRGPLIAFAFAVVFLGFSKFKRFLYLIPIIAFGVYFVDPDALVMERFLSTFSSLDRSSLERQEVQKLAWNAFIENPIVGRHFIDTSFNSIATYPHNVFLETAMALGILGLVVLIVILFSVGRSVLIGVGKKHPLVVAFFIQIFIGAQFSGSIWLNEKIFSLSVLIIALGGNLLIKKRVERQIISNVWKQN